MNYLDLYSSYPDQTIVAAWSREVRAAENIPGLAAALIHCGDDVFSRFARVYAELRGLPRGARRLRLRDIATSCELGPLFSPSQQKPVRHLRRKLTRSLAGAALLMALSQGTAAAATITVTTKDPRIRPDGKCSLIEAIVNANSDTPFFPDCPAGSGSDTIVLPPKGNFNIQTPYADSYGPTGLPLITSPITIQGNGSTIHQRGNSRFRLMAVSKAGSLTLQNVGLRNSTSFSVFEGILNNGTLAIENSTISGTLLQRGSALVVNRGSLTIENSTITGNKYGRGVINGARGQDYDASTVTSLKPGAACFYFPSYTDPFYGYQAAVTRCSYFYSGALTISNSTISKNNSIYASGGAIFNFYGTTSINNSTISGNRAFSGGGLLNSAGLFDSFGKYFAPGQVIVADSEISKNSAVSGGGIFNKGSFTIGNTTISGNKADDDGGGIFNAAGFNDGAGHNLPGGDLTLIDSTISHNRARHSGGGLVNYGSLANTNAVISDNKARTGSDVFP